MGSKQANGSAPPADDLALQSDSKDGREELLSWFVTQWPTTIDIVGDFAGSELFLIHGESLLRHCLVESKVDFDGGFQLLHAVYAVENFLSNLYQRGCNFDVVFFRNLKDLCVPPGTDAANVYKYQLARTVIIRHLARSAPSSSQDGNPQGILEFDSLESAEFADYFQTHPVHFLFCHEGEDDENDDTVQLRHLIYKFLSGGTSVASVNSVEWRSSKVFTPLRSAASAPLAVLDIEEVFDAPHTPSSIAKASHDGLKSLDVSPTDLCVRERLATLVCKQVANEKSADVAPESIQAFILHIAVLQTCTLQERQAWIDHDSKPNAQDLAFIRYFSETVQALLEDKLSAASLAGGESDWDLYDLIDGRTYLKVLAKLRSKEAFPAAVAKAAQSLGESVAGTSNKSLTEELQKLSLSSTATPSPSSVSTKVLSFSHPVLDEYLHDIKLEHAVESTNSKTDVVFEDLNHWQDNKAIQSKKKPDKADLRAMKRHQRFMAEIAAYSASLTGSNGRMIDPETVVVSSKKSQAAGLTKAKQNASERDTKDTKEPKVKPQAKGGKKPTPGKGGRENALKAAQEVQERKAQNQRDTIVRFWRDTCVEMQRDPNLVDRYLKAVKFLFDRSKDDLSTLGSEVQVYLCHILGQIWAQVRKEAAKDSLDGLYLIAMEFKWLQEVAKIGATPAVAEAVKKMNKYLEMPIPALTIGSQQQPLSFELDYKSARNVNKLVPDYRTLQLEHGGPYMDRRFDSQPDSRVPFEPDAWQRKVLDCIDIDHSLLVVAPTSAGKTFISFYAMKKVLEESDDAVLVYVAPTKALVNQVAAEVGARFSKSYHGKAGKSVWGIHTRDYRINNPTGCQILVTVPHILQIMLLSPTNSSQTKSWSRRIKRIIFDEVHSIGQSEEGVVWEQLLLLAPCPIIALSATVGNPEEFRDWLTVSQAKKGYKMEMIVHGVRYSDLRKFIYEPPEDFSFQGLQKAPRLPVPGLDEGNVICPNFQFVHPVSVLTYRNRGALEDITLEARDCLTLWKQMTKIMPANTLKEVGVKDPASALPEVIAKSEVLGWEASLKAALGRTMSMPDSVFPKLRESLEVAAPTKTNTDATSMVNSTDHVDKLFALVCDLHAQDSLPAIVFNYDRGECERAAQSIMNDLKSAETEWKETSSEWGRKMKEYERWKKAKENAPKEKVASRSKTSDGDSSKTSKLEIARAEGSNEISAWESFDPLAPVDEFSFADSSRMQRSEFEDLTRALQYAELPPWLMEALLRGIGVHHAGMNRRYRQAVEILFRKGFLRVVVATGTLAMGINMPCKTVVFSGNSIYLTAQNFRQAAGRAGRRGFDLLGNVVFNGFTKDQVYEIMSSRLPDLRGQFPVSTTLVLRLFGLLHGTKNSTYAVDMVQSLLSHNRLYLGGPEAEKSVKHHLRFSIEYLRRQQLLSGEGVPVNFSGLVSHLYFTENAVFAFHALLKGGYFHQLCAGIENNPEKVLLEMTLVLSHLFNRIPVQRTKGLANRVQKSTSVVFLPRLSTNAEKMLMKHNAETLSIFKGYVNSFISHNLADKPDRTLPFTKVAVGQPDAATAPPASIRSPFVALSGFGDEFKTIHELCSTVRGDVFLEESTIPYVPIWPHDTDEETNAYIYDFWKHGDMKVLVKDNMIKGSEVWFHLKDFALTLSTIVTSLENLIFAESDPDAEEMEELHDLGEDPSDHIPAAEPTLAPIVEKKKPKKKAAVVQSWDDSDEDGDSDASEAESEWDAGSGEENEPAWQQSGGGLKNVLKAFTMLRDEFDVKFKKVWA